MNLRCLLRLRHQRPETRVQRLFDATALALVLLVAAGVRLSFLTDNPPLLLTTDSLTYALPAIHLANGEGFDLSLRRTPGYPLFLAALWSAFGDDARPLVNTQHLLGLATAGLTWFLGRLTFGRLAGLLGGLAVALSSPQVIYEHYLMTEALFTFLLVLSILTLVMALRRLPSEPTSGRFPARWFLLTGLLFGLCALTRPVGQIFWLLVPVTTLFAANRRTINGGVKAFVDRRSATFAARATLLALLGCALVLGPAIVRNRVVGGELTGSSALGKTLFGRITRHDHGGLRFDLPAAGPAETDPRRAEARAFARRKAVEDTSRGSLVHEALMRDFGYTEAQAYNVMRDVALEIILAQPDRYVWTSLVASAQLFLGEDEPFRMHLARLANRRLRDDWEQYPELRSLLPAPVPPDERWQMRRTGWAVQLYLPSDDTLSPRLAALFFVGLTAVLLRPNWRHALPLPLMVVMVLILSAFLDGPNTRFRYPLDPLISLTAAGGLLALVGFGLRALRPRPALSGANRSNAGPRAVELGATTATARPDVRRVEPGPAAEQGA